MTDEPNCDLCDKPATHIAFDPHAPAEVRNGSIGVGRIVLFLCKLCAAGTVGAMLLSAGMKLLELK